MERILGTMWKKVLYIMAAITLILIASTPIAANAATDSPKINVYQVLASDDGVIKFTYRLEPLEAGSPMPEGSTSEGYTFEISGTDSVTIELANCNRQGVYQYRLFQVIGAPIPGYICDKREYTINIHVDAEMHIDIVVYNEDGTKAETLLFQNAYHVLPSDKDLMDDLPVRKTVFGSPGRNSTFEFKLVAGSSSNPMPPGSVNGAKSIYITGSGRNEFGVWSYDKAGTYFYTVYETNNGVAGYTYDTAVYTVTDMVKAENGKLVLTRVVTNDTNRPVTSFIFNNYYSGSGTTNPPPTNPPPTNPPPTNPPPTELPSGELPSGELPSTTEPPPGESPSTELPPVELPSSGNGGGNSPKTGDDSNNGFYIGSFVFGAVVTLGAATYLVAVGIYERRR